MFFDDFQNIGMPESTVQAVGMAVVSGTSADVEAVAADILKKYQRAFEELAR